MSTVAWDAGRLVPVANVFEPENCGLVTSKSDPEDPLVEAVHGYDEAMRRAVANTALTLPQSFGEIIYVCGYPHVAVSDESWRNACAATCRQGHVGFRRRMVQERHGKNHAVTEHKVQYHNRQAPVTHLSLRFESTLPRLPRKNGYFRVWMLRTRWLRVPDDRKAGGEAFLAAYDELWAGLGRQIEELIPRATKELGQFGVGL